WERLEREGRLRERDGDARQSDSLLNCQATNVVYKLPNETVVRMLRETVGAVYSPEEVYRRFTWNAEHVFGKQIQGVPPTTTRTQQGFVLRFTLGTLRNV